MNKNKLYFYLARLDKSGVEILTGFPFQKKVYPTRVRDLASLGVAPEVYMTLSSKASENRMTHELYAESASSYEDLKRSLSDRGYKNLPLHQFSGYTRPTPVNCSSLVTNESTMIRRASRRR